MLVIAAFKTQRCEALMTCAGMPNTKLLQKAGTSRHCKKRVRTATELICPKCSPPARPEILSRNRRPIEVEPMNKTFVPASQYGQGWRNSRHRPCLQRKHHASCILFGKACGLTGDMRPAISATPLYFRPRWFPKTFIERRRIAVSVRWQYPREVLHCRSIAL